MPSVPGAPLDPATFRWAGRSVSTVLDGLSEGRHELLARVGIVETRRGFEIVDLQHPDECEILNDGEGGGHSWMQEHLEDHYHSAWHAWRVDDAAMLNKGTSRRTATMRFTVSRLKAMSSRYRPSIC